MLQGNIDARQKCAATRTCERHPAHAAAFTGVIGYFDAASCIEEVAASCIEEVACHRRLQASPGSKKPRHVATDFKTDR
jgi:hypothetical protein